METKITDKQEISNLFEEINNKLIEKNTKLNIFLIGGGALMFHGAKTSTKDLDIIMSNKEEYVLIREILIELGFNKNCQLESTYDNFELEDRLEKNDYLLDIFDRKVCGKLELSNDMISRCEIELELSNLNLYILSLEDIFVFKSITDRPGDVEDSAEIIKKGIDWKLIEIEIFSQIKESTNVEKDKWITFVAERLETLKEDYSIKSPIEKKVFKLTEEYYEKLEKQYSK